MGSGHKIKWYLDLVVLEDHMTNRIYISTTTMNVASKLGRISTCQCRLSSIKSHDPWKGDPARLRDKLNQYISTNTMSILTPNLVDAQLLWEDPTLKSHDPLETYISTFLIVMVTNLGGVLISGKIFSTQMLQLSLQLSLLDLHFFHICREFYFFAPVLPHNITKFLKK